MHSVSKTDINSMLITMWISLLLVDLLRHLRCFVAVAEELHFGRAAARLHMAQPPLSQRIQRLERELGVRLFDRSNRRVSLTGSGRLLLAEAQDVLAAADQLYNLADRARRGEAGTLRAGLPPDTGDAVVAALLTTFRSRCPGVELELSEATTAEQLRALGDRGLDVGVLRHPFDATGLTLGAVLRQSLGVLLPASAALAERQAVRLADLTGQDLTLFPRSAAPALYDELLSACARHGFTPRAVRHARDPRFARGVVLAGHAVALVAGHEDDADVVWRPLVGEPLAVRTSPVWPRDRETHAVREFATAAVDALTAQAGMREVSTGRAAAAHPRPASEFLR